MSEELTSIAEDPSAGAASDAGAHGVGLAYDATPRARKLDVPTDYPALAVLNEQLAGQWASELGRFVGSEVKVSGHETLIMDGRRLAERFAEPHCVCALSASDGSTYALLVLERPTLYALLEAWCGSPPKTSKLRLPERARFSSVETRFIRQAASICIDGVASAWGRIRVPRLRCSGVDADIDAFPFIESEELAVVSSWTLKTGAVESAAFTVFPLSTMEPLLEESRVGSKRENTHDWRERVTKRMNDVHVDVVAELGRIEMSFARVLQLAVGDVVRLDQAPEEPVHLSIGGTQQLRAKPTVHRGNLALVITPLSGAAEENEPEVENESLDGNGLESSGGQE